MNNFKRKENVMPSKGETCKDLMKLYAGDSHTAQDENYVITEDHTISDVVRWLIGQSSCSEIKFLIDIENKTMLQDELDKIEKRKEEILKIIR